MSGAVDAVSTISPGPPRTDRRITYLPCLDGVRAIAVLLVLGVHFPAVTGVAAWNALWSIDQAVRGGYVGVDLFFVLSGFLITRILLRQRMLEGSFSFVVFYGRRALRTFPIYYATVLACVFIVPMDWSEIGSLLFYAFNYYQPLHSVPHPMEHTWSLAVEEQFYAVWPIVLAWLPLRRGQLVTGLVMPALAVGAAILFASVAHGRVASDLIYMSMPTRMMSLSLGAFLAFREQQGQSLPAPMYGLAIVAGIGMLAADQIGRHLGLIASGGWYWVMATLGYSSFSFGVIAALVFGRSVFLCRVQRALAMRLLRAIGRVSYGLYLYHLVILFALGINPARIGPDGAPAGPVLLAAALTFAVAFGSYHLIEHPLLRLKDRLRRNADGRIVFGAPARSR